MNNSGIGDNWTQFGPQEDPDDSGSSSTRYESCEDMVDRYDFSFEDIPDGLRDLCDDWDEFRKSFLEEGSETITIPRELLLLFLCDVCAHLFSQAEEISDDATVPGTVVQGMLRNANGFVTVALRELIDASPQCPDLDELVAGGDFEDLATRHALFYQTVRSMAKQILQLHEIVEQHPEKISEERQAQLLDMLDDLSSSSAMNGLRDRLLDPEIGGDE